MKQKSLKLKIKQNKLSINPLFIKFLNWQKDKYSIETILEGIKRHALDTDKVIIQKKLNQLDESFFTNLDRFHTKFKKYIDVAIASKNLSDDFIQFLNLSFLYIKENVVTYLYNEERNVQITDPNGRWLEAFICYNFIQTFNYFTIEIIKKCPICGQYFCHKGKYAVYCSDGCKSLGVEKRKNAR